MLIVSWLGFTLYNVELDSNLVIRAGNALLKYCRAAGAIIGFDPESTPTNSKDALNVPSALDNIVSRLDRMRMAEEKSAQEEILTLLEGEDDGTGVGGITMQEDPAWDFGK
jgi:hypothetical protein